MDRGQDANATSTPAGQKWTLGSRSLLCRRFRRKGAKNSVETEENRDQSSDCGS